MEARVSTVWGVRLVWSNLSKYTQKQYYCCNTWHSSCQYEYGRKDKTVRTTLLHTCSVVSLSFPGQNWGPRVLFCSRGEIRDQSRSSYSKTKLTYVQCVVYPFTENGYAFLLIICIYFAAFYRETFSTKYFLGIAAGCHDSLHGCCHCHHGGTLWAWVPTSWPLTSLHSPFPPELELWDAVLWVWLPLRARICWVLEDWMKGRRWNCWPQDVENAVDCCWRMLTVKDECWRDEASLSWSCQHLSRSWNCWPVTEVWWLQQHNLNI